MSRKHYNITAIIYDKRGNILSIGKNNYVKTHPFQAKLAKKCNLEHKIFLHAEVDAIIKCRDITKAHKIVITRVNHDGSYGNAKPCPICQQAIKSTAIKVVEYT